MWAILQGSQVTLHLWCHMTGHGQGKSGHAMGSGSRNEAVSHATSCLFNLPLTGYDNVAGAGSH